MPFVPASGAFGAETFRVQQSRLKRFGKKIMAKKFGKAVVRKVIGF
jgi:hypothetical protein